MGNYEQLKQAVFDVIKTNGNQEITGAILQNTLLSIISTIGINATFAGIAKPTTNPGTPDQNVFYIASENGTYSNFNGVTLNDEVVIFSNKNGSWEKTNAGLATQNKLLELESKTVGIIVTHEFTTESYDVNLDFNYKAGDEVIVEVFTDNSINTTINGNSTTPYQDGDKYPSVSVNNGYGKATHIFNEDGKLTVYGYPIGALVPKKFKANFRLSIISNDNIFSAIKECRDINNEITDIKGYKEVNSKVLNISSTVSQENLQFPITANKKYLLKVDCSEPYNVTILGNPKLNYINGNYYEDGLYPGIKIVNGKGSITISNNTDTSLSSWGFASTETSALYEGDYTFTLLELSENSESLMLLRQSIDEIKIPPIAKANGFIRIFHSMGGIGDSLSSGEIVTGNGTDEAPFVYNDRYNFSWLANIARKYSADWRCFSNGGQTAQGWLERWLSQLTSEENKRSLYFIALGTNDEGFINKGQLVLGTKGSNSDESSFAGYYKKIIESVHAYSEHSIIMCCTTYGKQTVLSDINSLIQEISSLYDYCYFINIAQKSTFNLGSEYARGGHFDTIGYVKIADAIEILVDDVIENNKTKLSTWGVNAPN